MSQELVKDWMSRELITINVESCCLPKAHRLMADNHIRRLPVIDKKGHLVGIVTRGDVRGAEPSQATSLSIWELNYLLANLKIADIMTANPVTVNEDQTIGEAADLMLEHKISGLPVVNDGGELVGIITESDIFRMVVRHEWSEKAATP